MKYPSTLTKNKNSKCEYVLLMVQQQATCCKSNIDQVRFFNVSRKVDCINAKAKCVFYKNKLGVNHLIDYNKIVRPNI